MSWKALPYGTLNGNKNDFGEHEQSFEGGVKNAF